MESHSKTRAARSPSFSRNPDSGGTGIEIRRKQEETRMSAEYLHIADRGSQNANTPTPSHAMSVGFSGVLRRVTQACSSKGLKLLPIVLAAWPLQLQTRTI